MAERTWHIVTGAAGFIGGALARALHAEGKPLVLVDDFRNPAKAPNHAAMNAERIPRETFPEWLQQHGSSVQVVYHLGARTDTLEQDEALFTRLNLAYSKAVWAACTRHHVPLIYASSAATYGAGTFGFEDTHAGVARLQPLNPYGWSKQRFDLWALAQTQTPPFWAGLKFFNVYGWFEGHKGKMASMVYQLYQQILHKGSVKLFASHRPDFGDGEQLRDFVAVSDVVSAIQRLRDTSPESGLYNLGSGQARTFNWVAERLFETLGQPVAIAYFPMPEAVRAAYQYKTQAPVEKLISATGWQPQAPEDGIRAYAKQLRQLHSA